MGFPPTQLYVGSYFYILILRSNLQRKIQQRRQEVGNKWIWASPWTQLSMLK